MRLDKRDTSPSLKVKRPSSHTFWLIYGRGDPGFRACHTQNLARRPIPRGAPITVTAFPHDRRTFRAVIAAPPPESPLGLLALLIIQRRLGACACHNMTQGSRGWLRLMGIQRSPDRIPPKELIAALWGVRQRHQKNLASIKNTHSRDKNKKQLVRHQRKTLLILGTKMLQSTVKIR